MEITRLSIPDVLILKPVRHQDDRGFFSETYNRRLLENCGLRLDFVQDNHAYSVRKGTIRGLHFQSPPHAQAKLIRVVRGAIFDVAVDMRRGSPYYGRWASAIISPGAWNQILVPAGFAHGLCTLEDETEVLYKVTDYYDRDCDLGIAWNDPALGIEWPVTPAEAIVSDRDQQQPAFADLPSWFQY